MLELEMDNKVFVIIVTFLAKKVILKCIFEFVENDVKSVSIIFDVNKISNSWNILNVLSSNVY